jgi:hypothetical protein
MGLHASEFQETRHLAGVVGGLHTDSVDTSNLACPPVLR